MTEAFIKAAEAKGHSVVRYDASFMNIGFCHGCETCYKTGKACSFGGDFNTMAPDILEADAQPIRRMHEKGGDYCIDHIRISRSSDKRTVSSIKFSSG